MIRRGGILPHVRVIIFFGMPHASLIGLMFLNSGSTDPMGIEAIGQVEEEISMLHIHRRLVGGFEKPRTKAKRPHENALKKSPQIARLLSLFKRAIRQRKKNSSECNSPILPNPTSLYTKIPLEKIHSC